MVASYHFGKEDSCVEQNIKSLVYDFLYLFKGSVIIFAPLLFHNEKTNEIFQILNLDLGFFKMYCGLVYLTAAMVVKDAVVLVSVVMHM